MGAVWLGRDEVLGRPVAVKRVGLASDEESPDAARAEREAKIAASLNHPHIVGVFDLVVEDGQAWMVMEYVEGTTLSELVRSEGPLSPDRAGPIIAQAASALAAAHANGVVHRDVKPSNILVRNDGRVKLTDFGIARGHADAALTRTGLVTGSPPYLAPEVASGQQATPASDVWSLGATLFHSLAGNPPYDATDSVLGALYRIVHEEPPRLEDAGWLAPLLEATMNRVPQERWTMVDIGRFLDPEDDFRAARTTATLAEAHTRSMVPDGPEGKLPAAPGPAATAGPPAPGVRRLEPERRRPVLPIVIGALVALLVVAIVVLTLRDDAPLPESADPGTTPSATPTPRASPSQTPSPSPSPEAPAVPTPKALRGFLDSYLSLATSDPGSAFDLLTPAFQAQSDGYEQFWGSVSNPRIQTFSADPAALTVSYTYSYQRQGFGRQVDDVRLQLVAAGDSYLIAGEA